LAVGVEYLRKNPKKIKDVKSFFDGIVMLDLASDKDFTHYLGKVKWGPDSIKYIEEPTKLKKIIEFDKFENDSSKGNLLHAVTDEEYYKGPFVGERGTRRLANSVPAMLELWTRMTHS